jgi:stearoyl-CoA desaturase (delta-9 desaturase)
MLRDRDLQVLDRLFPVVALASLALPFALGYLLAGTLTGAITALVWAGLVRMALLHHVTWGVNSLCHTFGRRSDDTKDHSTNMWILSMISLGDSWHNVHHAHPSWARHGGTSRAMFDPSARLIRFFEQLGWVTKVRWPIAVVAPAS